MLTFCRIPGFRMLSTLIDQGARNIYNYSHELGESSESKLSIGFLSPM